MAENSAIEWTHHTFNPWWGCIRVSPGCEHCYAEAFDRRIGGAHWGPAQTTERRFFGEKHWNEPVKWARAAVKAGQRRRVFCASMADVFEDNPAIDEDREHLWITIQSLPELDWLLLTKRPENVMRLGSAIWRYHGFPQHVWIGTTVESQEYADKRIPELLKIPAAVRFLSCEPLLGPVDLWPYLVHIQCVHRNYAPEPDSPCEPCGCWPDRSAIDWVIAGGESGAHHRPMAAAWAQSLRDQCVDAGVPFLFKQWGGRTPKAGGRLLDGREWNEYPEVLRVG